MEGEGLLVFVEKHRQLGLCRPIQSLAEAAQGDHFGDHAPAGLLRGGGGDFRPALQLFGQGFFIGPGHTALRGEGDDLRRAQFGGLLDHVLQLVGLGEGHVHRGEDLRLAARGGAAVHHQAVLPGADVGHGAGVVRALSVADCDGFAGTKPQDLCVLGGLPGQGEEARSGGDLRQEKPGHGDRLLSAFFESILS